jgi:hypothetical protein
MKTPWATSNETNYAPGISALKPRRVRMATSLTVEIISEVVLRGFLIRIKCKERGMMRLARPSSAWDTRRSAQCSLARGRRREATARNKLNYLRDVSHCPSSPIIQRRIWTAGCAQNCAHRRPQQWAAITQLKNWSLAADHDLKLRRARFARGERERIKDSSLICASFLPSLQLSIFELCAPRAGGIFTCYGARAAQSSSNKSTRMG